MGSRTYTCCDECGNTMERFVEIEGKAYCSRECYLMVCKRLFDTLWAAMLNGQFASPKASEKAIPFQKKTATADAHK